MLVVSRAAGFIHRQPKRMILELPFLFGLREFSQRFAGAQVFVVNGLFHIRPQKQLIG
jgi:hypothetical protein